MVACQERDDALLRDNRGRDVHVRQRRGILDPREQRAFGSEHPVICVQRPDCFCGDWCGSLPVNELRGPLGALQHRDRRIRHLRACANSRRPRRRSAGRSRGSCRIPLYGRRIHLDARKQRAGVLCERICVPPARIEALCRNRRRRIRLDGQRSGLDRRQLGSGGESCILARRQRRIDVRRRRRESLPDDK